VAEQRDQDNLNILLVDDDISTLDALKMGLEKEDYKIFSAVSRNEAINIIKSNTIDIVISDLKLKDGSGLDILNYIQENFPRISVVIVTAFGTVDSAIEALRGGAYDYLQKPFRMNDLKRIINRLAENIYLRRENEQLKQRLYGESNVTQLIGSSSQFRKVIEFIKQVAPAQSTVLITGESGTGKEVVASAIHYFSTRYTKPFIKINCGAIPENLLESELFGYEQGAFTGAQKQKKGKIELAHEGTLFLDEIGELQKPLQVKLLHVLQNGEFERLGGTTTIKTDVRVIAATNKNLEDEVKNGNFREDLFYRLNVISIDLPTLHDRSDDIPLLVQHFIEKYNRINNKSIEGIDVNVLKNMKQYKWKGNIRELENMIERAVVLSNEKILTSHLFPALTINNEPIETSLKTEVGMSLADLEKNVIERTLRYNQYDKNKTAMMLQIGLTTLYRKLKEYNLDKK
jgi:DNA-binding NtrC family response regulator